MAILIGTNTALLDDPLLTTRLAPGGNPLRLVIDLNLKLYPELKVFDSKSRTIVFNHFKHEEGEIFYFKLKQESTVITQILQALHSLNIQSLIVEGGAKLLQSFIDEGFWDEARIITNEQLAIGNGLPAPLLKNQILVSSETCFSDRISYYSRKEM
jgi:diaminohydroxyphosphoribosylaminopyrimidine deaminase/5-amino-6-(5-phosphoribosylamino)uracil reductase